MKFSIGRSIVSGLLFVTILSPGWAPSQQMPVSTPAQEPQGSAELRFKETSFDFGTIYQGAEVVHEFPLQNAGSKPLVISRIATRWGSTATLVSGSQTSEGAASVPFEIPPGGEAAVRVILTTRMAFGHQERTTQVHSDDPRNPVVSLKMTGEVKVAVYALPPMLSLGGVMQGEPMTQSIRLFPSAIPQVDIKSMEFNRSLFTMQNKEIEIRGRKGQEIVVTLNSALPPGEFKDELVIGVPNDIPPIRVPIWGAVVTQEEFAKLMKELASEDPDVRSDAADALGEIHNAASTQPLIQVLLTDKSEEVRSSAADALGMKQATEALDALIKATSDPDVLVRDSAVEALDALGDARAEEALKRALADEDEMVRESAAKALENLRRRAESR